MKSILLVGGGGYVGTVLTSNFLKKGYKVNVIDNFVYDNQFAVQSFIGDENYNLFYGSMDDTEVLDSASRHVTDVVILAGLVGDPVTKKYPSISDEINNLAVKRCVDYFDNKDIDKLIFISTCSNYGLIKDDELANEEFELSPLSLYAKAKVSAEQYILAKKEAHYHPVILRFATAFGLSPRMRFDLSVSEFTRDIYFDRELVIYDEHTWRPYCHVRDFARLIEIVLNTDNTKVSFEIFNAGGDVNNFTKKMIVDAILAHIPSGKVSYASNGSDPRNYKVSFKKVKSVLGFEPQYSVQDGIRELIHSFDIGLFGDVMEQRQKYENSSVRLTEFSAI